MSKLTAVIFDVDGTLRDGPHREHLAQTNQWDEFFAAQMDDIPMTNIIDLAQSLSDTYYIIILSGSMRRELLKEYLKKHHIPYDELYNRDEDDYTPDEVLKTKWYKEYVEPYYDVIAVFDDRNKVVRMWRQLGLTCCQVNEGFIDNEERRRTREVLYKHYPFSKFNRAIVYNEKHYNTLKESYDKKIDSMTEEILEAIKRC